LNTFHKENGVPSVIRLSEPKKLLLPVNKWGISKEMSLMVSKNLVVSMSVKIIKEKTIVEPPIKLSEEKFKDA